jgi:1-acyl-sn-glycerol-3-phosphate acyltransferase
MTLAYWIGHSFYRWFGRAFFNWRVLNKEYLNVPGGALIVANHESFLDPPLIGVAFDDAIYYLARKTLFDHPIGGAIIRAWQSIPVDQEKPDPGSLKTVIRLLRKGEKVLMFPEGQRSWDGKLLPGQPGVGFIVAKAGVPVIPMRIFGAHKALPRGGSIFHPSEITVVAGPTWHFDPLKYPHLEGKELYQRISDELMEQIAALHS